MQPIPIQNYGQMIFAIESRMNHLPIQSIDKVELVMLDPSNPQSRSVSLNITVTIPYQPEDLSKISLHHIESVGVSSVDTLAEIVYLTPNPTNPTTPTIRQPTQFSFAIPVFTSTVQKPLMDHITLAKSPVIHQTICLPGQLINHKPVTYRIRLKIHVQSNEIELGPVSTLPIDFERMRDSWNNFSIAFMETMSKLKNKLFPAKNKAQTEMTPTQQVQIQSQGQNADLQIHTPRESILPPNTTGQNVVNINNGNYPNLNNNNNNQSHQ